MSSIFKIKKQEDATIITEVFLENGYNVSIRPLIGTGVYSVKVDEIRPVEIKEKDGANEQKTTGGYGNNVKQKIRYTGRPEQDGD